MIDFEPVFIPPILSSLLKLDLKDNNESYTKVIDMLMKEKGMRLLFEPLFAPFSSEHDLALALQTMGWEKFRNRLVSAFYQKEKFGKYPKQTEISFINHLLEFEERFKKFSIRSNSRLLLFALFLDFESLEQNKDEIQEIDLLKGFPLEIDLFLKEGLNKSYELDWLLFTLYHFSFYFGSEDCLEIISNHRFKYSDLYELLSVEKREHFIKNALSYAGALGETEIFELRMSR